MHCKHTGRLTSLALDGRLSGRDAVRLQAHLAACAECATLAEDLLATRDATVHLTRHKAPPDFLLGVDERIGHLPARPLRRVNASSVPWGRRWFAVASVAVVLASAVVVWDVRSPATGEHVDVAATMRSVGTQVVALSAANPLEDVTVANLAIISDIEAKMPEQRDE